MRDGFLNIDEFDFEIGVGVGGLAKKASDFPPLGRGAIFQEYLTPYSVPFQCIFDAVWLAGGIILLERRK